MFFFLSLQCGQTNNIMIMTPQYPVHVVHNHEDSKNNVITYDTICYINIYNCIIHHIIAGLPRRLHMFSVWDVRWVPLSSTGTPRPFQLLEYQWRESSFDLICVVCRCLQQVKKRPFQLLGYQWREDRFDLICVGCRCFQHVKKVFFFYHTPKKFDTMSKSQKRVSQKCFWVILTSEIPIFLICLCFKVLPKI